ncbi:hypothetical protein FOYG_10199 [Fusarium oxysporum NRRL 32931]|uniref:Uncharacterized protein n=1 Tax=Fusarium oxysporum NRRL 32931 TaxID=660029 RepID=W9I7M4_FUSOX|nr:hypothetical protein FOYG_10199 [Fusarium oxysporum NRRL 32931]EWY89309.1 hypothetical protein FOYG_10199 [Fusarium oxysporum NRRL 32931]EWY89310.1 hypothetical protein FOYG_10199 [Fusarium oxysporum NRRL 32931]EWY89311.1 hypothetical protein FOYG_10199 [Fusarium oxysporum NRRL 32931]EWY89312.1 hypothetical protein FOYG_10199 [Fusarium oxysporum NRRL 32931]
MIWTALVGFLNNSQAFKRQQTCSSKTTRPFVYLPLKTLPSCLHKVSNTCGHVPNVVMSTASQMGRPASNAIIITALHAVPLLLSHSVESRNKVLNATATS